MIVALTCKHCVHYLQLQRWCDEWGRMVRPNTVTCGRFVPGDGTGSDNRPFSAMFTVTITPDDQSAAFGGGKPVRQTVPDEQFETAARLWNEENLTESQVAERMGVDRNRAKYLLLKARRKGLVRPKRDKSLPKPPPLVPDAAASPNGTNKVEEQAAASMDGAAAPAEPKRDRSENLEAQVAQLREELAALRRDLARHVHLPDGRAAVVEPIRESESA